MFSKCGNLKDFLRSVFFLPLIFIWSACSTAWCTTTCPNYPHIWFSSLSWRPFPIRYSPMYNVHAHWQPLLKALSINSEWTVTTNHLLASSFTFGLFIWFVCSTFNLTHAYRHTTALSEHSSKWNKANDRDTEVISSSHCSLHGFVVAVIHNCNEIIYLIPSVAIFCLNYCFIYGIPFQATNHMWHNVMISTGPSQRWYQ